MAVQKASFLSLTAVPPPAGGPQSRVRPSAGRARLIVATPAFASGFCQSVGGGAWLRRLL